MATLPDFKPLYGSSAKKVTPRVLKNDFGDGYTQVVADGINNLEEEWSLTFHLRIADADTLESFCETQGGHTPIDWTPPRESTAKKWIIKSWTRQPWKASSDQMTLVLKRAYVLI
jgi:phage-related protein